MRRTSRSLMFCIVAVVALISWAPAGFCQDRNYTRLVVLSDPHLPGRITPVKEKALRTINSWTDVDMAPVLGDICNDLGTKHGDLWTNSLYLFSDKVVVKTYDHEKGHWIERLERQIKTGNPGFPRSRE